MSPSSPASSVFRPARRMRRLPALAVALALLLSAAPSAWGQGGPLFPRQFFELGDNPRAVVTGDVNGDGALDALVANSGSDTITVLLGDGLGDFTAVAPVPVTDQPQSLALGDMDGDLIPDLVVPSLHDDLIDVLLGNGDGTFGAPTPLAVAGGPRRIVMDDFDGDGDRDVAVSVGSLDGLIIALGAGDGTFSSVRFETSGGLFPDRLVAGDVNGDEVVDLAVIHLTSLDTTVLLGDGRGGFDVSAVLPSAGDPTGLALADLDGGGTLDVIVSNDGATSPQRVELFPGVGDGTFGPVQFPIPSIIQDAGDVTVADLENDGDLDLVVAESAAERIGYSLQGPGGVFGPLVESDLDDDPEALISADLNGDDQPDLLAVLDDDREELVVVLGQPQGAPFAEAAVLGTPFVTPKAVGAGDFTGDGFSDAVVVGTFADVKRVLVFPGAGDGTAGAAVETFLDAHTDNSVTDLLVADFDGDTQLDVAVVNQTNDRVAILLGQGDGSFGPQADVFPGFDPTRVVAGDVNGDTILDLVTAHEDLDLVAVMLGAGDGSFGSGTSFPVGDRPEQLALGDFDEDGDLDLVTANQLSDDVSVLIGGGDGSFGLATSIPAGSDPLAVDVGDFDNDDHLDVAVVVDAGVRLLFGDGTGAFPTQSTEGGSFSQRLLAVDITGDGELDLITRGGVHTQVLVGDGAGAFVAPDAYVPDGTGQAALADFDDDGALDLLVGRRIVLNRAGLPSAFADVGQGLAGTHGLPSLTGDGTLEPVTPLTLALANALENTTAWMVLGVAELSAPFKGGVLVPDPAPPGFLLPLPTGVTGTIEIAGTWPAGVPSAFDTWFQFWIQDAAGPVGFAASNALRATTP